MEVNPPLYFLLPKKLIKFFYSIEQEVLYNLRNSDYELRPAKGTGIWCFTLLPTILLAFSMLFEVTPVYRVIACLSLGILCYCMLFTLFVSISCLVLIEPNHGGNVASSMISTLMLYIILERGFLFSIVTAFTTVFVFSLLLRTFLTKCPKTFTLGEAMVVSQGTVLSTAAMLVKCNDGIDASNEADFNIFVVFTALSTVGLIVAVLTYLRHKNINLSMQLLTTVTLAGVVFALVGVHMVLGLTFTAQFMAYIFWNKVRVRLLGVWSGLVLISVAVLLFRTIRDQKADTVTRKVFHVLASMVFLSGILLDVEFMKLAAGVGLGLLIFVEALRKLGIEPLSSYLEAAFIIFRDEKDCGVFAMTPIYLYTSLASGLALTPCDCPLELLGGVLGVGIGDTFASFMGKRFGATKWKGSNKTLEGTVFNVVSQVLTIYALQVYGMLPGKHNVLRTMVSATASGLVEAKTDQIDNLVLPLVNILAFQCTWFLAL